MDPFKELYASQQEYASPLSVAKAGIMAYRAEMNQEHGGATNAGV